MLEIVLFIALVLIPAIVLHEVAHGLSAYWLGDPTAKEQGRLTLNPIKHIDPVGSLLVPGILFLAHYSGLTKSLMLFGWAKPVPVNFRNLRPWRLGMATVALAGPLTNVVLAFIFSRLYQLKIAALGDTCAWGVVFNLTLAVFNMMPIPPLDGSRVVSSCLPIPWASYYNRLEPFGIIILIVLLNLGMFGFLYPIVEQLGYWIGVQI
jgi:Zn-dependent protease